MIAGNQLLIKHGLFVTLILSMVILFFLETLIGGLSFRPTLSLEQQLMEPWRAFTAHLTHAGAMHLFLNLINLLLLRFVFIAWMSNKAFITFLVFSALFISIGLFLVSDLGSYVGFSGIFHGLLTYLLLKYWPSSPKIFSIALFCVVAKIIYEQLFGASKQLVDLIGINIAIDSHALGLSSGIIFYCIYITCKTLCKKR